MDLPSILSSSSWWLRSTGRWSSATLGLVLLALMIPPPGAGQEDLPPGEAQTNLPPAVIADQAAYTLAFDHATGVIELRNQRGTVQERWETRGVARPTAPLAKVPPNRPLVVVVENANSLLYEYGVTVDVVGEKQINSCSDVGGQFASRAFMLSVGALQGITSPPPPNFSMGFQQPFLNFQNMGASRGAGGVRGGATLNEAALERALERVRTEVESYLSFADQVGDLSNSLPTTLDNIALLAESRPIDSLLADLQNSVEALAPGLSDPSEVAEVLRARSEAASSSAQTLETLFGSVTGGGYQGSYQDPAAVEVRALRSRLQASASTLMDSHRALQEHLLRIENARARSVQGFSAGASQGAYRRVTIGLRENPEAQGARGIRTGDVQVYTEPHLGMACHFSFGFGILERPQEYSVAGNELSELNQDDLRTAANVLFHVGPSALPLSLTLGAGFGLERAPDLYMGGSVRFFHPLMISAGIAWQRQRILGSDLAVGSEVSPSFRIEDLDLAYRSAFFVGLSISP